jgi:hypothetical protein
MIRFVPLLLLVGCSGALRDPPPRFDHTFAGELQEHVAHYNGGTLLSWAQRDALLDGFEGHKPRCDIFLPAAEDHGIGPALRAKLRRLEIANCNGGPAADVNGTRVNKR